MNHDEAHGLRIQLAAALKERDEARAGLQRLSLQMFERLSGAESERDALRADNGRLREALKPFAAVAPEIPEWMPHDKPVWGYGNARALTIGDLRHAALAGGGDRG